MRNGQIVRHNSISDLHHPQNLEVGSPSENPLIVPDGNSQVTGHSVALPLKQCYINIQ